MLAQQQRETVAKPPSNRQKSRAEARLKKELETPYKKWLDEEVGWIISDEERTAFKRLQTDDERQEFIDGAVFSHLDHFIIRIRGKIEIILFRGLQGGRP